ncbi:protein of unknown function [Pseudonocardia thermophila]|uniref:DUF1918 domain-containing protein n=1 Tax=Pseudonocardia thermophila TaxID=1848 RepID=A0A1M6S048_PSETH|nr:DUF1918 domain-containing protein [Pseudonocardia thermophila]SHK38096.1 protein of unknown function [Pseudonocardia thermophila]
MDATVDADVGDYIYVPGPVYAAGSAIHAHSRQAKVLEVIEDGGRKHYRVRWQEGQETLYFPGPDAQVERASDGG